MRGSHQRVLLITGLLALLTTVLAAPRAASSKPRPAKAIRITPGPYRANARFTVSYAGSASWHTTYHSTPPNPGGRPDTNDAHDSSTQRWSLRFNSQLNVPRCGHAHGGGDPCLAIKSLLDATGSTRATGSIAHRHVDGLYAADNASASCRLTASTPAGMALSSTVELRYLPASRALAITALTPVSDALNLLPVECPGEGDSLDGLNNNYFTPGFSFAGGFGPGVWFTSRRLEIPASAFHRSARIAIELSERSAGTPPKHCAVPAPSYQRCTTGGSWSGVLAFVARP